MRSDWKKTMMSSIVAKHIQNVYDKCIMHVYLYPNFHFTVAIVGRNPTHACIGVSCIKNLKKLSQVRHIKQGLQNIFM